MRYISPTLDSAENTVTKAGQNLLSGSKSQNNEGGCLPDTVILINLVSIPMAFISNNIFFKLSAIVNTAFSAYHWVFSKVGAHLTNQVVHLRHENTVLAEQVTLFQEQNVAFGVNNEEYTVNNAVYTRQNQSLYETVVNLKDVVAKLIKK